MKAVVQEEASGCGIASAAALAGVSYIQAKETAAGLGIFADDRALWSSTAHVRLLVHSFGISVAAGEVPFTAWDALPDTALLAIKWRRKGATAFWHWVVFWRGPEGPVVLDPKAALKTNVRRDFGRMKPKWFIPVLSRKNSDKE
ncbi:hypothetical protein LJC26_04430 [Desulfovibrio sp. OttesenSCG-928-O18]|nr:hypothetical protein [Desulfovibrio sp. OttesenSCG-928-O18]